jgi:hypothetical protein
VPSNGLQAAKLSLAVLFALVFVGHQHDVAPSLADRHVLVNVNAIPWARIAVDGRTAGETPLGNVSLPLGRHSFQATFADGSVVEKVAEIGPDARFVWFRRDG